MRNRRYFQLCTLLATALMAGCAKPVDRKPSEMRVVSLAPNLTEIICAVGCADSLVGRTTACDYPPKVVKKVPAVGGFGAPSMELLVSVSPTLVLDIDLEDETVGARIEDLGLRRERIRCRKLDDIPAAIARIGSLLNREKNAGVMAGELKREIAQLREHASTQKERPSVYVEIWHDPMMTVGRSSFLSELIRLAGGRNSGDDVDKDYYKVSDEWVLSRNPDIVICLYMARGMRARQAVSRRPGWKIVKAVKSGAVYDGLDNNMVLRPGPRVLEGIRSLKKCIGDTQ